MSVLAVSTLRRSHALASPRSTAQKQYKQLPRCYVLPNSVHIKKKNKIENNNKNVTVTPINRAGWTWKNYLIYRTFFTWTTDIQSWSNLAVSPFTFASNDEIHLLNSVTLVRLRCIFPLKLSRLVDTVHRLTAYVEIFEIFYSYSWPMHCSCRTSSVVLSFSFYTRFWHFVD